LRCRGKCLGKSSTAKPAKSENELFSFFVAEGFFSKTAPRGFPDFGRFRLSTKRLVKSYYGQTGKFTKVTRGDHASRQACCSNMPAAKRFAAGILAGMLAQHACRNAPASRQASWQARCFWQLSFRPFRFSVAFVSVANP